jgi:hypothetical protein
MIAYASRTGTRRNLIALREHNWRLLVSARGRLRAEGFPYALDNGAWTAFTHKEPFDFKAFEYALSRMGRDADWVVAPDIVGGGMRSFDLSVAWLRRCLDSCSRVLLAVQDGMTLDCVSDVVGQRIGLFVGGTTEWKLSSMPMWGALAASKGLWFHVARVNSTVRILLCCTVGATSFDGSSASRYALSLPRLDRARRRCHREIAFEYDLPKLGELVVCARRAGVTVEACASNFRKTLNAYDMVRA